MLDIRNTPLVLRLYLRRIDDKVVILSLLERIDFAFVENSFIDGFGNRAVDEFTK